MKNKEVNSQASNLLNVFLKNFKSIQVHAGQVEKLCEVKTRKVYMASYQNLWDGPILEYVLKNCLQENILFFNQPMDNNILVKLHQNNFANCDDKISTKDYESASSVLIFINLDTKGFCYFSHLLLESLS